MPGEWDKTFVLMAPPPNGASEFLFYDASATANELPRPDKNTYGNSPESVSADDYTAIRLDPPRKARITLSLLNKTKVMYVYQLRSRP